MRSNGDADALEIIASFDRKSAKRCGLIVRADGQGNGTRVWADAGDKFGIEGRANTHFLKKGDPVELRVFVSQRNIAQRWKFIKRLEDSQMIIVEMHAQRPDPGDAGIKATDTCPGCPIAQGKCPGPFSAPHQTGTGTSCGGSHQSIGFPMSCVIQSRRRWVLGHFFRQAWHPCRSMAPRRSPAVFLPLKTGVGMP